MYKSIFHRLRSLFDKTHPLLINTIPKSGTNLLMNVVNSTGLFTYGSDFSYAHERCPGNDTLAYLEGRLAVFQMGSFIQATYHSVLKCLSS